MKTHPLSAELPAPITIQRFSKMRNTHRSAAAKRRTAMTYAARPSEFVPCLRQHAAGGRVAAKRPGILRRLLDAVYISRQQQAEREVVRYLEGTGGRPTA